MRHIFHRILDRYLEGGQYAFDASPRELWPEPKRSWHPLVGQPSGAPAPEHGRRNGVHRELEPHN
jgi:hypothetical protein